MLTLVPAPSAGRTPVRLLGAPPHDAAPSETLLILRLLEDHGLPGT